MKLLRLVVALLALAAAPAAWAQNALPTLGVNGCGATATGRATGAQLTIDWNTGNLCGTFGISGVVSVVGASSNASSGVATSATNIPAVSYNYAFNGTTWDQIRSKPASTAPLATDPALVVSLGPNSSGLITTGTAGSPASQVVTVQGIASGTGLNFASQYPAGAVAITGNGTGTTGAVVGTLAASASIKTYICGFNVSATGGVATLGPIIVAGLVGSSQTYQLFSTATGAQLNQTFTPCIPSSAINTAITITTTADATASAVDVNSWGYQL